MTGSREAAAKQNELETSHTQPIEKIASDLINLIRNPFFFKIGTRPNLTRFSMLMQSKKCGNNLTEAGQRSKSFPIPKSLQNPG